MHAVRLKFSGSVTPAAGTRTLPRRAFPSRCPSSPDPTNPPTYLAVDVTDMTDQAPAPDAGDAGTEPPIAKVIQLYSGKWSLYAVHAAAELGLADALADGPRTPREVADATGIQLEGAELLLRALAALEVVEPQDGDLYALTPVGAKLRSGPSSMGGLARILGRPWHNRAWEGFVDQLRTGECAMEAVHGKTFNEFLGEHPSQERAFGRSTSALTEFNAPAVTGALDLSDVERIVDVGGGYGVLLAELLETNPDAEGVLFELGPVAESAREHLADVDLSDRIEIVAGDYTETVPEGGDVYVLSNILHNHDDVEAVALLDRIREAMAADGRVVVVDFVLDDEGPDFGAVLGLELWVMLGGRNRTLGEFEQLLEKAGFEAPTVHETPAPSSVIEATPA